MLHSVFASCNCSYNCSHHHNHNYNHQTSSHSESHPVYLVRTEQNSHDENFPNCTKHYLKTQTTINYYSDGSRRTYINSTIYNKDGSVIVSDCNRVNHILYNNEHYFIICKNKGGCSIINSKGNATIENNYSKIEELAQNRFLVKLNKKFGIIDLKENIIVPIKYQKFEKINKKIFITKLNGYYGILDIENNILAKNDCERIKQLFNTILLKRYGKYGLYNLEGKAIYNIEYDKIKALGEYILVKKDKKYQILDFYGNQISDLKFDKIKLKRNTLYGFIDKKRIEIN